MGVLLGPKYRPILRKFFASQKPVDVVRFLTLHTKAINAESTQEKEPITISFEERQRFQQKFSETFKRVLSTYPEGDKKRMLTALQNPMIAPANDVCKAAHMTSKVLESLDTEMKVLYAYTALSDLSK